MINNTSYLYVSRFLVILLVIFLSFGQLFAIGIINTPSLGYRFLSNQMLDIILADGSCKRIANDTKDRFIPTRTMLEWFSFASAASFLGTIGNCPVNCSYVIVDGVSCNKACGPGRKDRRITITIPASGGGTCSVTEGQFVDWGGSGCNVGACHCSSSEPSCFSLGTCTLTYNATSINQIWVKDSSSCGFACKTNYGSSDCSVWTGPVDAVCDGMRNGEVSCTQGRYDYGTPKKRYCFPCAHFSDWPCVLYDTLGYLAETFKCKGLNGGRDMNCVAYDTHPGGVGGFLDRCDGAIRSTPPYSRSYY